MRFALAALALLSGCAGQNTPQPAVHVAPAALVRAYRDTPQLAERAWNGRVIMCRLLAGTYTAEPRALKFHAAAARAPCVAFEFSEPVRAEGDITVRGLCLGAVRDAQHRGAGVEFCVVVTACQLDSPSPSASVP